MKINLRILLTAAAATFLLWGCKTVHTDGKSHPDWIYDAVVYEMNTRQFTPEGTFEAARRHFPRLDSLGVDIIWLMPIHPIGELERKGTLGSYYAPSDYYAVNPEFGTMDDFKAFVDDAHSQGFRVIIDWVANHTSPDAVWTANSEWYLREKDGSFTIQYDWTDIAKLDYSKPEVRAAMTDAMLFWVRETGIDGYRCDAAAYQPVDFWESVSDTLVKVRPDLFLLAEAEKPELNNNAFDAYYGWELHHIMNGIAGGKKRVDDIWRYFETHDRRFPKYAIPLQFTSNHDENSWNGTEFERLGAAAETFAVLSYVVPGMPMIYNGQEVGFDRRLEFFEKDSIDWDGNRRFTELYTTLNRAKKSNRALWCAEEGGKVLRLKNDVPTKVFSLIRQKDVNSVVAVMNLSPDPLTTTVTTDLEGEIYANIFSGETITLDNQMTIELEAWGYKIFIAEE